MPGEAFTICFQTGIRLNRTYINMSKGALLIVLFAVCRFFDANATDILVIFDPASCVLFNQYEQPMSAEERESLPVNAPFEIINDRELMGDQVTKAMRLSLFSTTYYLMLDSRGKPSGLGPAAASRYNGCTRHYDTVTVAIPSVKLYSRFPPGGKSVVVKKDENLVRIFSMRNATFFKRLTTPGFFGWSNVAGSSFRAPDRKASSRSEDDFADIHKRIMKRLIDANQRYDTLFSFFNTATGQGKSIPVWQYSRNGAVRQYRLKGSEETVRQLESSTRLIFRDIEYTLMGKPFHADMRNGTITIEPQREP